MAILSTADRLQVWRGLMRYWSNLRETCVLNKADLQAAVASTDTWIDDNVGSYNTSLPAAAQSGLSATQKVLLFCAVALMRVSPGVAALLRRALGVNTEA